jgi:seryl-tRNA synthetase
LVGTSEIPLAGLYADKIIKVSELPLRFVGFSHCFRVEAGSRGSAERGLYRLVRRKTTQKTRDTYSLILGKQHQFSKVEMFAFCQPAMSEAIHDEMLQIQKELFSELGIHYRSSSLKKKKKKKGGESK